LVTFPERVPLTPFRHSMTPDERGAVILVPERFRTFHTKSGPQVWCYSTAKQPNEGDVSL